MKCHPSAVQEQAPEPKMYEASPPEEYPDEDYSVCAVQFAKNLAKQALKEEITLNPNGGELNDPRDIAIGDDW